MKSRKLIFLFAAALMMALTYVTPAQAGGKTIWENPENPCNKVSLSGSVRYRYEQDSRDTGSSTDDRNRQRVRTRLGFKVMTGHGVTAGVRLSSRTDNSTSANQDLKGFDNGGGAYTVGFDRGYVKYNHGSGFWLIGGKWGNPAKQLSGAWFNGNYNPEGIALGYSAAVGDGKIKLSLAQIIMNEKGWLDEGDDTALQASLHWGGKVGDIKIDAAFTNLAIDETAAGGTDTAWNLIVLGAGMGPIKGGVEYFTSDVDEALYTGGESDDTTGMVVHVRYKINDMLGVRAYYYSMGAVSAPVPQSDFAESANFTGTRIQLDVKAAGVNMDFRYYTQSVKNDKISSATASALQSGGNGYMHSTLKDHTRIQANFVVGF